MSLTAPVARSPTKVLRDLINHVFLLPKLPEQEFDKTYEKILLKELLDALRTYKDTSKDENHDAISKCIWTITDFQQHHEQGRPRKEADLCAELKLRRLDSK